MLLDKIRDRAAKVLIIGGGYVGLPLATRCAQEGFITTVYDFDESKIEKINRGESYIYDVPAEEFKKLVDSGMIDGVWHLDEFPNKRLADIVLVCVPTPLNKTRDPDVSYAISAANAIVDNSVLADDESLVVLESTVYPGFTREVFAPILTGGMEEYVGVQDYIAFSAERVDPGNPNYNIKNTTKVVGGCTAKCTEVATAFYEQIVDNVHTVSSTDASEMTKILENTFRMINIGLANETALNCKKLGMNAWEVIDAAATKPFGFMKFTPGPGVGGHCIGVDPHYLSWKLKTINHHSRFIELAEEINSYMPKYVVELATEALNAIERSVKGSNIMVVGVAYKPNTDDVRESPALYIIEALIEKGANVVYYDPHVPSIRLKNNTMISLSDAALNDPLFKPECSIIVANHDCIDFQKINDISLSLVDTRNSLKNVNITRHISHL